MTFEKIIELLREFNYEKNGMTKTMEFIDYVEWALRRIEWDKETAKAFSYLENLNKENKGE